MAPLDPLNRGRVDPRACVESTLSAIWREVLLAPHVDLYDHFLDLGGSSLLATQVMSRVRDRRDLPTLNLPTNSPRPARQTFRGSYVTADLPDGALDALKRVSAKHRAMPYMTLFACFKLLRSRYCGQSYIAVESPIANRTHVADRATADRMLAH